MLTNILDVKPVGRKSVEISNGSKQCFLTLFYILLTVHLVKIFANNQLEALFQAFIYFISLHVSSITELIISRSNCINTSSGMISLCE